MEKYKNYVNLVLKENEEVFGKQNLEELQEFLMAIKNASRIFIVGAGREGIAARGFVSCSKWFR